MADLDREQVLDAIEDILGINPDEQPDPLVDTQEIAKLAGVQPGTVVQWIQRTRRGELAKPFPPRDKESERWSDKPLWRATSVIVPWLDDTQRWPPGAAARPMTRGPRSRERV